ncbi:MAG: hypothetical protein KBF73_09050 [Flavobacteriales bacterium]|nr:hypothetical protein [Flavobacteriales bacterium]
MKRISLLLIAVFLSCTASFAQNLNDLNWIIGTWEMVEGPATTTETWELINDSTFVGSGITKQSDNIVFEEELGIEYRNGEVIYIAVLPDKTAHFKMTDLSTNSATFEDPANDFPNKIVYVLNGEKMDITLFGIQDGKEQNIQMSLVKK